MYRSSDGLQTLCTAVALKERFEVIAQTYESKEDAKKACIYDEMAYGVYKDVSERTFKVQRSKRGAPFTDGDISDRKWVYLKAYDPSQANKSLVKVANIQPIIFKRGVYRMIYKLDDLTYVKLARHTCEYVNNKKCRNCSNPEWHAKCCESVHFLLLSHKSLDF